MTLTFSRGFDNPVMSQITVETINHLEIITTMTGSTVPGLVYFVSMDRSSCASQVEFVT